LGREGEHRKQARKLGVVAGGSHACNPSNWEDGEFQNSLDYTVRPCLEKQTKNPK
jgi:hypothetical protein